jgi:hypothetical protein
MHGANPLRPQEIGDGQSLWVQEVFYTLQGEGPFTGHPALLSDWLGATSLAISVTRISSLRVGNQH